MKEIIEYMLAVLIILSIVPFYNMVVTQFYTPEKSIGYSEVSDLFVSIINQVFIDMYNYGNISIELTDIKASLENIIKKYAGSIYDDYYFYARIYTPLNITVDPGSSRVIISSPYNMSMLLLLVSLNGTVSYNAMPTATGAGGNVFNYIFDYSKLPVKSFSAIIAVSGYGSTWFIGHWLNTTVEKGYAISDTNRNLAVIARDIGLKATKFYNFTGYNTTLYYFTGKAIMNYTSSWTNISWQFVQYNYIRYNITETMYMSRINGRYNETLYMYNVYLVKGRNYTIYYYNNGTTKPVESTYEYSSISNPVYNMVLVSIYDGAKTISVPIYSNVYEVSNTVNPPPQGGSKISSYIRIGMFTYMVDLWSWRR
ncbi:MAG: hypothetical protein ACP5N5_05110 [Desulfurococcus sp.]|uniref:hypothetical protein n=1 Tax=Desulfurococcus sp. TaxID=51678 RepID=UPI003D1118AA